MLSERDVHSSVHCSQPFCSSFRCSWWFGRTQNKATTRLPGILCNWSGRLEQSTTGHSFGTDIINVQKHFQDTSFLTFQLLFPEYEQRTLYSAFAVTLAMLLRLINCRFIIIIIILLSYQPAALWKTLVDLESILKSNSPIVELSEWGPIPGNSIRWLAPFPGISQKPTAYKLRYH